MIDVEITIPTDQKQCQHCSGVIGATDPSEKAVSNYEKRVGVAIERPICSSCFNKGQNRGASVIRREFGVSINMLHAVARAAIASDDFTAYSQATGELESGLATVEHQIKTILDELGKLNEYRTDLYAARRRIAEALSSSPSANYFNRRTEANRAIANPALRFAVFKRDGHKCLRCDRTRQLTIDHIKPVKLGGTDEMSNLQTLCKSCNCSKGDNFNP